MKNSACGINFTVINIIQIRYIYKMFEKNNVIYYLFFYNER